MFGTVDNRSRGDWTRSYTRPRGRAWVRPPARVVDRDLLPGDRRLANPRPPPRDRGPALLRRRGADQRVHDRLPGAQPRAGARRRRRALVGLRPGLLRTARARGEGARLARRVDALLVDAARARRADGGIHRPRPL